MSSILWPTGSSDIMPMTSIWRQFIQEFNMAGPVIGNVNDLWGETSNLSPVETGELRSSLNLNSFAFTFFKANERKGT
jgi:hypothetical protein